MENSININVSEYIEVVLHVLLNELEAL